MITFRYFDAVYLPLAHNNTEIYKVLILYKILLTPKTYLFYRIIFTANKCMDFACIISYNFTFYSNVLMRTLYNIYTFFDMKLS